MPGRGGRRRGVGAAIAVVALVALVSCSTEAEAPAGPSRLSSDPRAVRSPLPCREVAAILDLEPAEVAERYGEAMPLAPDELRAPGTDAAIASLRDLPRLAEALSPGRYDLLWSRPDGNGLLISVNFDPPVDLSPDLGVESLESGTAVIGPDGNAMWDHDAGAEAFRGVEAADLLVDESGALEALLPAAEPVWCHMTFDPDGGILVER